MHLKINYFFSINIFSNPLEQKKLTQNVSLTKIKLT